MALYKSAAKAHGGAQEGIQVVRTLHVQPIQAAIFSNHHRGEQLASVMRMSCHGRQKGLNKCSLNGLKRYSLNGLKK